MHPRLVGVALAILAARPALADPTPSGLAAPDIVDHASIGYLAHDVSGLWSGFRVERAATALNFDVVFAPHVDVLWGTIRPAVGGTVALDDGTSYGYADARYEIAGPYATFFGAGLGFAVHDGALNRTRFVPRGGHDDKALGSRVLFHVPLEVGVTLAERVRVSAYFEHVSNGWIGTSVNEGMDNVGARVGYKF
jgi:lipid A 3-O-deacylase